MEEGEEEEEDQHTKLLDDNIHYDEIPVEQEEVFDG